MKSPLLISAAFLFTAQLAAGQAPAGNRANMLVKVLSENHYAPRTLNDEFSGQVFDRFLESLDPNKLYFTQAEVNTLKNYRLKLDDELTGKPAAFLKFVTPFYKEKLIRSRALSQKLLQSPLNFAEPETFSYEKDGANFPVDEKGYQKRLQKWLKYQTLSLISRSTEPTAKTIKPELEAEARRKTNLIAERNFKRLLENPQGFEEMVQNLYLNAITYAYDPHSLYLSQNEYEDYKGGTSTEVFSFGLAVSENEIGEIEVAQVIPGSPAWKCNEINKGDVLVALKPPGKSKLDLTGSDASETQSMLDANQTGKVVFLIRKKNGLEKTVVLAQEKVESENVVKSFLLTGDKKIGYISLPGFYTEWENMAGLGCANDVAREILQLKREGMEGLILDIRYNGGGSMMEATSLGGLFVDEGALFMRQGKDGKPLTVKDTNRGTLYDGPLTLLVNSQSASASEILAATLQDYNRAVVVGMPTFGKATAQVVLPVGMKENLSLREQANVRSPHGYAVVTIEKLFRVTGKTTQLHGIEPDVVLPDPFFTFYETEADYETALSADSVSKKVYYTPLPELPLSSIQQKSEARGKTNVHFQQMKTFLTAIENREANVYPLTLSGFRQTLAKSEKEQEAAEAFMQTKAVSYQAREPQHEQQLLKVSPYAKELSAHLKKQLEEDIYLEEAYQITKDLINLTKNP